VATSCTSSIYISAILQDFRDRFVVELYPTVVCAVQAPAEEIEKWIEEVLTRTATTS
jgi:hypothetical protein